MASAPPPLVADFGVAGPAVKGRAVPGVPAYMAPEQAAGRDAGAADLWALGCIALDLMLPGRPPKVCPGQSACQQPFSVSRPCPPPQGSM